MRFYIWGDGSIWRISHSALRKACRENEHDEMLDSLLRNGRELSYTENWKTEKWSGVPPKGIYEQEDGTLEKWWPDVKLVNIYNPEFEWTIRDWCEEYL